MKENRFPVSTIKTGCIPFNTSQKGNSGYKVGENPVKQNGYYILSFDEALEALRKMEKPGWRDFGNGNSQSAHKAIGWVTKLDAERLLVETSNEKRVEVFSSLTDIIE